MKTSTFLKALLSIQTILFYGILNAQDITPTYLGMSDGLAAPVVNAVIQDSYGFLWIATENGMQKYDGFNFRTFRHDGKDSTSLQNNMCWSLYEDSEHAIWVGSDIGISRFDRRTNTFKNFNFTNSLNHEVLRVFAISEDSNNQLWAGTQGRGLLRFDKLKEEWVQATLELDKGQEGQLGGNSSFSIVEDSKGRLWSGIQGVGLFVRNPIETIFLNVNNLMNLPVDFAKSEHSITTIFVDSRDRIWITTRAGIYRLDPESGALKTLVIYPYDDYNVWVNWNSIREDKDGAIWVANNYHGLLRFEKGGDVFKEMEIDRVSKISNTTSELLLTTFNIDKSGIFWFGTRGKGIMKYDPVQKPFTTYTSQPGVPGSLTGNSIYSLFASELYPSKIYVGLRGAGLDIFDESTGQFTNIPLRSERDQFGGSARSLVETNEGTLLVGTWGDGIWELDKNYKEINHIRGGFNKSDLTDDRVRVMTKDRQGQIWIGTSNGLSRWNRKTNTFRNFKSLTTRRYGATFADSVFQRLSLPDTISILRAGDYAALSRPFEVKKQSLYLIASLGEGRTELLYDYGWIANEQGDTVWTALNGAKSFWAGGAVKNRLRIDVVSLDSGKYTLHYTSDDSHSYGEYNETPPDDDKWWGVTMAPVDDHKLQNSLKAINFQTVGTNLLSDANITAIELKDSAAWIGTNSGGLNYIDLNTYEVTFYQTDPSEENSLSDNAIRTLRFDPNGFLWIGTDNGLNKFDLQTKTFTRYSRESGLATSAISAIVNGDQGEMWISTVGGISRMVTNSAIGKVTFINYFKSDGLSDDNFVSLVGLRSKAGTYYFGSEHGLNTFRSVSGSQTPPDIVLSKLLISNRSSLNTGSGTSVNVPLEALTELNLSYDNNDLSFEFIALQYADPSKNQYAHKLEGFDEEWRYDNRNFASYTNLEPGNYTFKIRASNAYGVWNEEGKNIAIHIASPWWRTWLAYAVYFLIVIAIIFIGKRILQKRIALREREKSREKELAQAKEIEKAYHNLEVAHNDLKSAQDRLVQQEKLASLGQLTAGIAHEIKNPLNFVNNFSDLSIELLDELSDEFDRGKFSGNGDEIKSHISDIKANLQKINQHGTRADGIVKSMLQHSRGGSGSMDPTDLNSLVKEFVNLSFHGMRAAKNPINVILDFELDENLGEVQLIADDFSRVVLNIANNAFDAMREKTKTDPTYKPTLTVKTTRIGAEVCLSIADNGPGIPSEIKDKILQPFFTTKKGTDGTGLGLSITNDIVKAHGGEMKVESSDGEGTTFIISVPTNTQG